MGCGAHRSRRRTRSTTPASPRTATTRRGWRGCTAAPWASAATARSASASTWSATALRRLSTGGCSCPRAGTTPQPARTRCWPRRSGAAAARRVSPHRVRHREKWRLALDMLDEVRDSWELPDLPVVADAGYGDATGFRLGLTERGLAYAVAVKGTTTAYPGDATARAPALQRAGPPAPVRLPRYRTATLRALVLAAGRERRSHRHLAPGQQDQPAQPARRDALALRWPCGSARPTATSPVTPTALCPSAGCWPNGHPAPPSPPTTGCPPCPPTPRCANWSVSPRSAGASSTTTASSRTASGLDHFEGRSYLGWHRHVTLAALAQAFCTLLTTRPKSPCAGLTLYAVLRELQKILATWTGACSICGQPAPDTTNPTTGPNKALLGRRPLTQPHPPRGAGKAPSSAKAPHPGERGKHPRPQRHPTPGSGESTLPRA